MEMNLVKPFVRIIFVWMFSRGLRARFTVSLGYRVASIRFRWCMYVDQWPGIKIIGVRKVHQ